jgi:hypothetical protein
MGERRTRSTPTSYIDAVSDRLGLDCMSQFSGVVGLTMRLDLFRLRLMPNM